MFEQARSLSDQLIEQRPRDVDAYLYKADALLCLERLEECAETMDQISQLGDERNLSVVQQVSILNNLALVNVCRGRMQDALVNLRKCIALDPQSVEAQFNLVCLLVRVKDDLAACTQWMKYREFELDQNEAYYEHLCVRARQRLSLSDEGKLDQHVCSQARERQRHLLDTLILGKWMKLRKKRSVQRAIEFSKAYFEHINAS